MLVEGRMVRMLQTTSGEGLNRTMKAVFAESVLYLVRLILWVEREHGSTNETWDYMNINLPSILAGPR